VSNAALTGQNTLRSKIASYPEYFHIIPFYFITWLRRLRRIDTVGVETVLIHQREAIML